jgi:alginate O-acetyltransferase complex protein AlgI
MLFNSYQFLLIFLPIALIGYQIAGALHRRAVVVWLGLVSLAFYAYWRPALLYILVSSILLNYIAAGLISHRIPNKVSSRFWLISAIILDLTALCYFKYLFPSLNFLASATGSSRHWADVILPLGISFFTFTQIAYLIDLHQGIAEQQDFSSYLLFVTFFPHLIAGPILHHKEMMPQFQQDRRYRLNLPDLTLGISWFIMGLGKKVLLADNFSLIANPIFATSDLSSSTAWLGALSYSLQLYFDFSGYSDMALGLARMFSINFPLNFDSPFKSASIIEFWQRWHMTLSRYITAYLYTPTQQWVRALRRKWGKGVSRKDMVRPGGFSSMVGFPMLFTMFVAGLWHGAGFQFIVFGLLHGAYLTVNHAWRLFLPRSIANPPASVFLRHLRHGSSVLLTLLCVIAALVVFRARGIGQAVSMLGSMLGAQSTAASLEPAGRRSLLHEATFLHKLLLIVFGFAIVWLLPNTQQILSRFKPSLDEEAWDSESVPAGFRWSPNLGWALALGTVLFSVLVEIQNPSTFLYFQF